MKKLKVDADNSLHPFCSECRTVPVQTVHADPGRSSRHVRLSTKKHFVRRAKAAALWAADYEAPRLVSGIGSQLEPISTITADLPGKLSGSRPHRFIPDYVVSLMKVLSLPDLQTLVIQIHMLTRILAFV